MHRRLVGSAAALLGLLCHACGAEPEPEPIEYARPVKLVKFGEGATERTFKYPGRVFPNTEVLGAHFDETAQAWRLATREPMHPVADGFVRPPLCVS